MIETKVKWQPNLSFLEAPVPRKAWDDVNLQTITNCFAARAFKNENSNDIEDETDHVDESGWPVLTTNFGVTDLTFVGFVSVDNDGVPVYETRMDIGNLFRQTWTPKIWMTTMIRNLFLNTPPLPREAR